MEAILMVDDNPLRAAMRQSLLEGTALSVVRAHDAAEALCLIQTPEFAQNLSLVITGHTMSAISGPEFVAELRSRMPDVPILVLSSAAQFEAQYQGIAGVYFSQTKSPEELRALVNRLVRSRHLRRA